MSTQKHYSIKYSIRARYDLHDIRDYITSKFKAPETAKNQVQRITHTIRSLEFFPKAHRIRKINSKGEEIRFVPVDNYTIFYSVNDVKDFVNIARIIYGRRNITEII